MKPSQDPFKLQVLFAYLKYLYLTFQNRTPLKATEALLMAMNIIMCLEVGVGGCLSIKQCHQLGSQIYDLSVVAPAPRIISTQRSICASHPDDGIRLWKPGYLPGLSIILLFIMYSAQSHLEAGVFKSMQIINWHKKPWDCFHMTID